MWIARRYLLLSLFIGFVVALVSYLYLSSGSVEATVVIASSEIPAHTIVEENMVSELKLPAEAVHHLSLSDMTNVIGRHATRDIAAEEQILSTAIFEASTNADGLALRLEDDKRAFAVPATLGRAAGGAIESGNLVDVIHFRDSSMRGPAAARILLSEVELLDVRDATGRTLRENSDEPPGYVVLSVTPLEAESLCFALETGEIYLAVSSPNPSAGDRSPFGVTGEILFGDEPLEVDEDEYE